MKLLNLVFILLTIQMARAATLEDAFKSALQKNEGVRVSQEHLIQAEEQLAQAKSTVYPNLSLNATYTKQPEVSNPQFRAFSPEEQTTAYLTLKQPIFQGFREFAGIRQRKKIVSAQEQARIATLLQTYVAVSTSYLDILAIEQDLKNLGEQKDLYATRIKDLQGRIKRGESNSTEALTAQSTEAALEAEIRITQSRLSAARENFKTLTSLPADTVLADANLQSRSDKTQLKALSEYISQIEKRPDIISARELVEGAQEEVKFVRGGHWPSLDLIGNYYVHREPEEGYLSDMKWDIQLKLTFPLFEGGLTQSKTREAASRSRERELELNALRKKAEAEIASLHEGLKNRVDQLSALQRSSELAEKNYQVIQRDFRRGLSRSIDVQLALTEFRVARRGYDQARFAARLDWIRLQIASANYPASIAKEL